jgi:hypothetical protein
MDKQASIEIGKAAEHLVAADLILSGYRASMVEAGLPYDLVLDHDGRIFRVQVKTCTGVSDLGLMHRRNRNGQRAGLGVGYMFRMHRNNGAGGYRAYAPGEIDLLALVALDIRIIAYLPVLGKPLRSVCLRSPGHQHDCRAQRRRNVDEFPIEGAMAALTGARPVLAVKESRPQPEIARRTILASIQKGLFDVALN